ncbi:sodium-coupled monocarboxylate transporter 1-like [Oratosquilla oratoria]|uniref:sodium-coupled monocarboxylate transporter 1-like n=1 Tax=Oratosquilla oratoria TaxID=337810 RepID=UPI003F7756F7
MSTASPTFLPPSTEAITSAPNGAGASTGSPPPESGTPPVGGFFGAVDYIVLVLLTLFSILLGTVTAVKKNKKNTADDYLLAGRAMGVVPVALSLVGGFMSALSILGNATEVYFYGTQIFFIILGLLWGLLLVTQIFLPVIYPLGIVSVFEYLEMRYKSVVLRRCASMTQILNTVFYLGMCLYAPCLTLATVTRIPTWVAILVNGLICTAYVTIGGVRAVVYTDVLQTTLMFLGPFIIVVKLLTESIGLGTVWELADKGHRLEFFNLDLNPLVRHTFWNMQVLGIYTMVSYTTFNQTSFQRLTSVSSLKSAVRLCYLYVAGISVLWCLFNLSGLVAYAIYADCDPLTAGLIEKKDGIIPFLVLDKFGTGTGLVGLFVASVYGGVLSSVSSYANAVAAQLWKDFLCAFRFFSSMSDMASTITIKGLSTLSGLIAIALAFLVGGLGPLLQLSWITAAVIVSPMDGVFVAGIAAPWMTTKGAVAGFFSALFFNLWLMLGKLIYSAGRSDPLPLSVEGCSAGILPNATMAPQNWTEPIVSVADSFATSTMSPPPPEMEAGDDRTYLAIYDISYCYVGMQGVLIVFIVGTIVSCLTGLPNPHTQDPRVVHAGCLRAYKKVWDLATGCRGSSALPSGRRPVEGEEKPEEMARMVPEEEKEGTLGQEEDPATVRLAPQEATQEKETV